ncbi:hypothetical protein L218DRAFT_1008035 [Marasmius fiardii PR-910]|nr:hypothetical protein L218DRAFT_1008035 [Marasmius fiardii PR-910]
MDKKELHREALSEAKVIRLCLSQPPQEDLSEGHMSSSAASDSEHSLWAVLPEALTTHEDDPLSS